MKLTHPTKMLLWLTSLFLLSILLFQPEISAASELADSNQAIEKNGIHKSGQVAKFNPIQQQPRELQEQTLIRIIRHGTPDALQRLIQNGMNISDSFAPLLFYAVERKNDRIFRILIEHGANLDVNLGRKSILAATCESGYLFAASLLLDRGVDPDWKSGSDGGSALMYAALGGHTEIVKLLIDHGADINSISDRDGVSVFACAAYSGNMELIRYLSEKNDHTLIQGQHIPALAGAVAGGHIDVVSYLLNEGEDANSISERGKTVLIEACKRGQSKIVQLLLEHGASVNLKSKNGRSALYYAVDRRHTEIARTLISQGADVDGMTLEAAAKGHNLQLFTHLLEHYSGSQSGLQKTLLIAVRHGDVRQAKLLLQFGALLQNTIEGRPLLAAAIWSKKAEMVKLMLDYQLDPNTVKLRAGLSMLMLATFIGKYEIVELLLAYGADINAQSNRGDTALILATARGRRNIVQLLLDSGADQTIMNHAGKTAATVTQKKRHRG